MLLIRQSINVGSVRNKNNCLNNVDAVCSIGYKLKHNSVSSEA